MRIHLLMVLARSGEGNCGRMAGTSPVRFVYLDIQKKSLLHVFAATIIVLCSVELHYNGTASRHDH